MKLSGEIAAFNLERAVVHRAHHWLAYDAGQQMEPFSIMHWFHAQSRQRREELGDITAERATDRIAPWAASVIRFQYARGREIALYSSLMPEPIVEAYAEGIDRLLKNTVQIKFVDGVSATQAIQTMDARKCGNYEQAAPSPYVQKLQRRGKIVVLAAGTHGAREDLEQAVHPIAVNAKGNIPINNDGLGHIRIKWVPDSPHITRVAMPHDEVFATYDLNEASERLAFAMQMCEALD